MMLRPSRRLACIAPAALLALSTGTAQAQVTETVAGWFRGDWSLTLGASTSLAPRYRGADGALAFYAQPMISLSRNGRRGAPFQSRNDSISFALFDNGILRAGPTGRILFARQDDDRDLRGLGTVRWGAELGGFLDIYALPWLRLRSEIRHGVRAHSGVVATFAADAFWDYTPSLRFSGGPRLGYATSNYFNAYFGVNAAQSAASGLAVYRPRSGFESTGFGGAVTWKTTDKLTTSLFAEYSHLLGPAADSSLVRQRGNPNQYLIGVSATYRFDFSM